MGENIRVFQPRGIANRKAEQITFEQFCVADVHAEWLSRTVLPNGMIVLTYPRCVMICSPTGDCSCVRQVGTSISGYFAEAIEALEEVA